MDNEPQVNGGSTSYACHHSYIRKGYYLGLSPDVYICVSCGEQRKPEHWEDFETRRTPPAGLFNKAVRR